MKRAELLFDRPDDLVAVEPGQRAEARMMVSTPNGHTHDCFSRLAAHLEPGDLIVVNRSATLPASLPAEGPQGAFRLNLSTDYGGGLWLAEPRLSCAEPGPVPGLEAGAVITAGELPARLVEPFPGLPRLWFVQFSHDPRQAMTAHGQPIRYAYVDRAYPLHHYQTVFADRPGSAEMPSAAYHFTPEVVNSLRERGVELASITLHTGVSSLEVVADEVEENPLYPEPFEVPASTAKAVNRARAQGRRVMAVGTTVVRALESAWSGSDIRPVAGFTRVYIHPKRGINVINALLTGLHDPVTSHLAMLYAIAGQQRIKEAYAEAIAEGYRWHEFGDAHLILV